MNKRNTYLKQKGKHHKQTRITTKPNHNTKKKIMPTYYH
jgi:hypothetical protein